MLNYSRLASCPCRRIVLVEPRLIDPVHRIEIIQIGEPYLDLKNMRLGGSSLSQQRLGLREAGSGLRFQIVGWIADLPR